MKSLWNVSYFSRNKEKTVVSQHSFYYRVVKELHTKWARDAGWICVCLLISIIQFQSIFLLLPMDVHGVFRTGNPINHGIELKRLEGLGIGRTVLWWFHFILFDSTQKVILFTVDFSLCGTTRGLCCCPYYSASTWNHWVRSSGDLGLDVTNMGRYLAWSQYTIRSQESCGTPRDAVWWMKGKPVETKYQQEKSSVGWFWERVIYRS